MTAQRTAAEWADFLRDHGAETIEYAIGIGVDPDSNGFTLGFRDAFDLAALLTLADEAVAALDKLQQHRAHRSSGCCVCEAARSVLARWPK